MFLLFGQILQNGNVSCLRTFLALLDCEFDLLTFVQVAETFALNSRVVDKDIRTVLASNKAVALAAVEPFDRADDTFRHIICLLMAKEKNGVSESFHRTIKIKMTRVKKPRVIVLLFPT
jgi:hypothetical protein